jgi:large subunit ribosomal protein L1
MAKLTKKQKQEKELLGENNLFSPKEAVSLIKKLPKAKFDETLEVSFRLGINPKHADQQVRNTVTLPAGTGKEVRVAVVCKADKVKLALESGADYAGAEDLINKIQGGWFEFDILIATQDMMPALAKLGKILGPRKLMPNPKAGTVVVAEALPKAVQDFKGGKVEFRNDRQGNVHVAIGKASFDESKILKNLSAIVDAIQKAKPSSAKGTYMKSVTLSSTMGPGLRLDVNSLSELASLST